MAIQNSLIMNLLRIITPEEIGEIATKHNGGKFLSLTELVSERVEHKIYRDFSSADSMDEIHDAHNLPTQAVILPFKNPRVDMLAKDEPAISLSDMASTSLENREEEGQRLIDKAEEVIEHKENENMSSFILIEKARLKRSQQILKQKEIIDLYQKNSNVDVEQIKGSNNNLAQAREAGVLINKKQY
ncbi:MAG: hypothetical protein Q7U04_14115 [Bacteriovorax sp.]|nr:hypothetical protein [Bacteriovorax sp.]